MTETFRIDRERAAYRLLHSKGIEAYDERYGMAGSRLLNEWADRKLVRITYPGGGMVVRTFKKYAA